MTNANNHILLICIEFVQPLFSGNGILTQGLVRGLLAQSQQYHITVFCARPESKKNDPIEIMTSMQNLINSWGSLMEVTGGAINTGKSWWYLIDFVWKRGKWVAEDPEVGLDLIAIDSNGRRVSLKKLRCNEASEMLGVWITPNGDKKKTINYFKIAALKWAGKRRIGHATHEEV